MVANNFAASLKKTRVYEGGNDDDPRDPGGRTSRGITQGEYDTWRAIRLEPMRDVWSATEDEVNAIYRMKYWDKLRCDLLPIGIDFVTFDAGVNSGIGKGARWLQQALNDNGASITVDEVVGQVETLPAAYAASDKAAVVRAEVARRSSFLHALKTWSVFGGGWGKRVADVEAVGVRMVLEGAGLSPDVVKSELDKAADTATTSKTNNQTAAGTTAAGGTVAGGSQVEMFSGGPNWLVIAGFVVMAAAALYFYVKSRNHGQRAAAYQAAAATIEGKSA